MFSTSKLKSKTNTDEPQRETTNTNTTNRTAATVTKLDTKTDAMKEDVKKLTKRVLQLEKRQRAAARVRPRSPSSANGAKSLDSMLSSALATCASSETRPTPSQLHIGRRRREKAEARTRGRQTARLA